MNKGKGYFFIVLTTILFSTMEIAIKHIAKDFNPIQLTLIRFLVGGMVLLPFAITILKRENKKISNKSIKKFTLLGLIGVVLSMSLYQSALIYSPAALVAVLFSSNPLFVTVFASIILGEKIERKSIFAIIFEILGIVVIIHPWNSSINMIGVILTLGAAISFALYGVIGKEESQQYGGIVTTTFSFLLGSLELIFIMILSHINVIGDSLVRFGLKPFAYIPFFTGIDMSNILPLLYASIGVTGLGYACYFISMELVEAQTVSLVFFFKPILAPILAMIFIHEVIPMPMVLGITLIFFGSCISMFGDKVGRINNKY